MRTEIRFRKVDSPRPLGLARTQRTYYGNGKKREKRLVRCQTEWNSWCRYWEDAEDRISYFDYVTGKYRDKNIQKKFEV